MYLTVCEMGQTKNLFPTLWGFYDSDDNIFKWRNIIERFRDKRDILKEWGYIRVKNLQII